MRCHSAVLRAVVRPLQAPRAHVGQALGGTCVRGHQRQGSQGGLHRPPRHLQVRDCNCCSLLLLSWARWVNNVRFNAVACLATRYFALTNLNVCSSQAVRGYPTLLLFKNGSKEGIKYSGARELKALADFAKQHAAPAAATEA